MRRIALLCLVLVVPTLGIVGATRTPGAGVEATVTRTPTQVEVTNFPAVQGVSGTVNIGNLPAVQAVSGSVAVNNLPLDANGNVKVTAVMENRRLRFVG